MVVVVVVVGAVVVVLVVFVVVVVVVVGVVVVGFVVVVVVVVVIGLVVVVVVVVGLVVVVVVVGFVVVVVVVVFEVVVVVFDVVVVVLESAGPTYLYTDNLLGPPHVSLEFPAHATLQFSPLREDDVNCPPFTIAVPHQHSLPYSVPAMVYPAFQHAVTHASFVIDVIVVI